MFILFEMVNSRGTDSISNFDVMGYALTEAAAMMWVQMNPQFRCYKYCPQNIVS